MSGGTGEDTVVEGEGRLGQRSHPRRGARVAYSLLDASRGRPLRESREVFVQRGFFGAVFTGNAAAMGLDIAHRGRVDSRLFIRAIQRRFIGTNGRHRRLDAATGGASQPFDDGIDTITVGLSVLETLEHEGCRAFTEQGRPSQPIGPGVVGREHGSHVAGQIHRAHQGLVDASGRERPHGCFQGLEAGSLFAGQGEARTSDPKLPCQPARNDAAQRTHGPVGGQRRTSGSGKGVGRLQHRPAEVEVRCAEIQPDADEDPSGELLFVAQTRVVHRALGDGEH